MGTLVAAGAAAIALAGIGAPPAGTQSSDPDPSPFAFDGDIFDVLPVGDVTYVAGNFSAQLPRVDSAAVLAAPDGAGALRAGLPAVDGPVSAAVSDGAGGVFIGGEFTHVGTRRVKNLAHVRADGSVDPGVDGAYQGLGAITRLDVDGDLLIVGSSPDGGSSSRLDVLTVDGSFVTTIASVEAIQGWDAAGGLIHIAQQVAADGGRSEGRLVTVDPVTAAGGPDAIVGTPISLGVLDGLVAAVAVSGDTVVVAGERWTYDFTAGVRAQQFIAGYALGSGATRWVAPPGATAIAFGSERYVLEPADGRVYLARTKSGEPSAELFALDPVTGGEVWRAGGELGGDQASVSGLLVQDGTVYAGGSFRFVVGGGDRLGAAAFDAGSGALRSWDPSIGRPGAAAVAPFGGAVLLGGGFAAAGAPLGRAHDLARLRADGSLDTSFAPVVLDPGERRGQIYDIDLDGGTLYFAGTFTRVNDAVRPGTGAVDVATGALTPFTTPAGALDGPDGPAAPGHITAAAGKVVVSNSVKIAVFRPDGTPDDWDLLAALDLQTGTSFGGFARSGSSVFFSSTKVPFTRGVDLATRQPVALPDLRGRDGDGPGFPQEAELTFGNGRAYAFGDFALVGGLERRGLAEIDLAAATAQRWDAGANDRVIAAAAGGGKVFAVGYFSRLGGKARANIGAVDAVTGSASGWQPDLGSFNGLRAGEDRVILFGSAGFREPFREPYRQYTIPGGAAAGTGAALRRLLDDLDLAAPDGAVGHVDVPAAGRVRVTVKVGSYVVASGTATAAAAGPLDVPLEVNDAGRLILSVYPDFAFAGRARFVPADGGAITVVRAPVQRPAGG